MASLTSAKCRLLGYERQKWWVLSIFYSVWVKARLKNNYNLLKQSQPHSRSPSFFINLYIVLISTEQTFRGYSHGTAEPAVQLLFWRKKSWASEQAVLKTGRDLAFLSFTSMWKECSHGCNNLGSSYLGAAGVGSFLFVLICFRGSGALLLTVSTWLLVDFAHPALWGSAPTCLSYVASMDTLLSWQRAGKFSPSTQKEKEETAFPFWAPSSTIDQDKLPYSLPGFLEWFPGRS